MITVQILVESDDFGEHEINKKSEEEKEIDDKNSMPHSKTEESAGKILNEFYLDDLVPMSASLNSNIQLIFMSYLMFQDDNKEILHNGRERSFSSSDAMIKVNGYGLNQFTRKATLNEDVLKKPQILPEQDVIEKVNTEIIALEQIYIV